MNTLKSFTAEKLLVILWNTGDAKADRATRKSLQREGVEQIRLMTEAFDPGQGQWEYCMYLRSGDTVEAGALEKIFQRIREDQADFLYADECISSGNLRSYLWKPDYSPDLLRSENYIGPRAVFSRKLAEKAGFRIGSSRTDYDGILRLSEKAEHIVHVPEALVMAPGQEAHDAEYEMSALRAHLERLGLDGRVEPDRADGTYRIRYAIEGTPLVSVLIPNWEHPGDLKTCIHSIQEKTTWPSWEIVIVENNSTRSGTLAAYAELLEDERIRLVRYEGTFNYAAIMNFGGGFCRGDYILQLNNDTAVISPDWIQEMLMFAQRSDVGAVGAMLYYPDNTVQHAGAVMIWLDRAGVAAVPHAYKGWDRGRTGEMNRMALAQNYSCVTGACLMIRKQLWNQLGGMDEAFAVAYNDVDLCLRLRGQGYVNVWTPYAELYHMESKTRTIDVSEQQKRINSAEVSLFCERYGAMIRRGDPYANPNSDASIELQGIRPNHSEPMLYVPGTELDFSKKADTASFYELSGFWEAEKLHTWTVGHRAAMQFLFSGREGDMELTFHGFAYHHEQRMRLCVNGQAAGEILVGHDSVYSFRIPGELLQDHTVMEFELPDARRPDEVGGGNDSRCLGVGFRTMAISICSGGTQSGGERTQPAVRNHASVIMERLHAGDTGVHGGDTREVMLAVSDLRKNILRWYPFRKNADILEIYGGYGALTSLLLEKARSLTVVEPDPEKAGILSERFSGCGNLTVLSDIPQDGQFDYIVRMESELERGNLYDSENADLKSLLRPGGRLLWGLKNRLGMEQFSRGDGAMVSGTDPLPLTMIHACHPADRNEVLEAVADSGMSILRWYYPFPEHNFAYEVFSDESLQRRRPETDAFPDSVPDLRLFDAREGMMSVWDEGLAQVFCPSFFLEIGTADDSAETAGMDYVRISANRSERTAVCTVIDYSGNRVVKHACSEKGQEHIENMKNHAWQRGILCSAPLSGPRGEAVSSLFRTESLLEKMQECIRQGNHPAFWAYLIQLKSILYSEAPAVQEAGEEFRAVFGGETCSAPMHWIRDISIDLVPNNIYPMEQKWVVIDNEWVFDFPVPAEFILWRACLYLFTQNAFSSALEGREINDFLEIASADEKVFHKWEEHFQLSFVGVRPVPKASPVQIRLEELEQDTESGLQEKRRILNQAGDELLALSGSKAYRMGKTLSRIRASLKGEEFRDALFETGSRLKNV